MITAYAIIATFFLGMFVRHNLKELHARYREMMLSRKIRRDINKLQKENAKKDDKQKVGPNPFEN